MPDESKEEEPRPVVVRREPEKDLVSWTAPARPFKRRDREFYITIIAIAGIVGLVLFLIEGFMPVILIISLVFLFYVLSTVEPENIEHKITNKGVKVVDKRTDWGLMSRFWFSRRFDSELLVIETWGLPGRMELVINSGDKEEIRKALSSYIVEEEVSPSYLDKAANWFAKKLPNS
ncbi:hypothetical protein HY503_01070 [Candidatus Woesebacteria bacterium]|nr:hypothetical protein [Candidatus Woesebacteria bacterium]